MVLVGCGCVYEVGLIIGLGSGPTCPCMTLLQGVRQILRRHIFLLRVDLNRIPFYTQTHLRRYPAQDWAATLNACKGRKGIQQSLGGILLEKYTPREAPTKKHTPREAPTENSVFWNLTILI